MRRGGPGRAERRLLFSQDLMQQPLRQCRGIPDMLSADDLGEREAEWVGIDQVFSVGPEEDP
jgi:hypothetical protein